jgi:superfamily I DNA/RNA helicase
MTAPQPPNAAQIKAFKPSKYQQAIFDAIADKNGPQYIVVEAYAGSGKTTTLVKAATEYVDPSLSVLFCAFNKSIATEIGERVAGRSNVNSSTLHSLGKRALDKHFGTRTQVNTKKHYQLIDAYIDEHHPGPEIVKGRKGERIFLTQEGRLLQEAMIDLYNFARLTMTDPNNRPALEQMAIHYQIDLDDRALNACPILIKRGEDLARENREIDFTDMIYLPVHWDIDMPKFDWVFCDESQDLNKCQLELALKCRKPDTGRMVFVGDRRQAIYGFAGADNKSLQNIIDRTQATTLPLSICYRCATSILDLAREVTPQIEAREGAPVGKVTIIPEDKLPDYAKPDDMIVCRLTAPLISECIAFIKRGVKARVEGRDLGKQLNKIVKSVAQREHFDFDLFLEHLHNYKMQQVKMLRDKQADDTAVESMKDRCEAVSVVYEGMQSGNVDQLCNKIDSLFDEKYPLIKLATVHRCKGLEADRVFIIAPNKLPLNLGGWQQEQEWNLRYVAVTRAKYELFIVGGPLTPGPYAAGQPKIVTKGSSSPDIDAIVSHAAANIEKEEIQQLLDQIEQAQGLRDPNMPQQAKDDLLHELDAETDNESHSPDDSPKREWVRCRTCGQKFPPNMLDNYVCNLCLEDPEIKESHDAMKAHKAEQPLVLSKRDRERAELQRLFGRKSETAPDAQKGTQERRGPESDVNPAGHSGGMKTPAMYRQQRMFAPAENNDHMLSDNDAALLNKLNNLPEIETPAKNNPLAEFEGRLDTIDNPEVKQDAIEALEVLRDIFGDNPPQK